MTNILYLFPALYMTKKKKKNSQIKAEKERKEINTTERSPG